VHDGAVVVLHKVVSVHLVELVGKPVVYVLPVNLYIVISVASRLLVKHSQTVPDLMNRNSELHNGRTNKPAPIIITVIDYLNTIFI